MSIYHGIMGSDHQIQNILPSPRSKNISLSTNNLLITPPKNFTSIIVTRPLSQSASSTPTPTPTPSTTIHTEMKSESDILVDQQQSLSPKQQQQVIIIPTTTSTTTMTSKEEERRSEELQQILLDTIPILIKGIETLGVEVEQICNGSSANEKKSNCQVLIDIQKTLREYPSVMGYRSKAVPSNIVGKPKLISFRTSMDQFVWENISKLSVLKDFVESTIEFQKLCVIGITIRDALNSFVNNKCEYLIKGYEFNNCSTILSSISLSSATNTNNTTTNKQQQVVNIPTHNDIVNNDDAIVPEVSDESNNIISINISAVIHNGVRDEINNTSISALKKQQKQQPVVLSRAPKQVMESTRQLVDTVVSRKCMYREEKASIYREMMNDRLTLLKEDPKKFKQQLLQQRRLKLTNSSDVPEVDESSSSSSSSNNHVNSNNNNVSPQQQHSGNSPTSLSNGGEKENTSPLFSPAYLSTSPPKSPEFLAVKGGKKAHILGHARSFSADTHNRDGLPNTTTSHHAVSHNNIGSVLSPPLSPHNEKIIKAYKLLSSSPSTSSSAVVTSPFSQLQASQSQATQPPNEQIIDLDWEINNNTTTTTTEDNSILQCKGYKIYNGNSKCQLINYDELSVLYTDEDEYHYNDDFGSIEHYNFLGVNKNQPDNPICISVVFSSETNELLYIIRTGEKDEKYRLSLNQGNKSLAAVASSSKDMIKMIKKSRFNQLSNYKFKEIKSDQNQAFIKQLIQFEAKNIHKTFKFGVLYCSDQQGNDENELYSNSNTSDDFEQFLKVLGDRIPLQGWTKYRGGLDIKDNTTGTHSIYKKWRDFEIMYHVAPMIPCTTADEQSVERKRHLGNDIVLIIYKEGNSKLFDPSIIKSNFNHIFAVIQKVPSNNEGSDNNNNMINYKVSIGCKEEVSNFGPSFPKGHIFSTSINGGSNECFTDFLLTKLINGERSTLKSPVFAQKLKRTRKEFLHSFINDFSNE